MENWSCSSDTETAELPCQLWNILNSGAPLQTPSWDLEFHERHRQDKGVQPSWDLEFHKRHRLDNELQRDANEVEKHLHEIGLAFYHAVAAVLWLGFTVLRLAIMVLNMLLAAY